MTRGEKRRKVIFDVYSTHLIELLAAMGRAFLLTKPDGTQSRIVQPVYICPLCRSVFDDSAVLTNAPRLTLEDNPPKSLGGKAHILTCKRCNNSNGSDFDSQIAQYFDTGKFLEDGEINSSLDVRVHVDDAHMPSRLEHLDAETIAVHIREVDNPYVAKKFLDAYEEEREQAIDIRFGRAKSNTINLALLKIAHLEAFKYFGYGYLITPAGELIQQTLRDKIERVHGHGVVGKVAKTTKDGLWFGRIGDLRFFYVVYTLRTKKDSYKVGVIIPGWGQEAQQQYLSINEALEGSRMDFVPMKDHSYPFNPPHPGRYQLLWEVMIEADRKGEVFTGSL